MKNSDLLEILKVTLLSSCRFQTQKKKIIETQMTLTKTLSLSFWQLFICPFTD